jgi:hypothetical protein
MWSTIDNRKHRKRNVLISIIIQSQIFREKRKEIGAALGSAYASTRVSPLFDVGTRASHTSHGNGNSHMEGKKRTRSLAFLKVTCTPSILYVQSLCLF